MKTSLLGKFFLSFLILFTFSTNSDAQILKKLGKRAQKAAERTVERRVEKETTEKTDQALDSILEPGTKEKKQAPQTPNPTPDAQESDESNTGSENTGVTTNNSNSGPKTLEVYSKFDFVPGDKQLFFDDFSNDFVGDFPSKWNTNGSGEVVILEDGSGKWFEVKDGSNTYYVANLSNLPEEYTVEFDVEVMGMDKKTSSAANLAVILDDSDKFGYGVNCAYVYLPFIQYGARGIRIWNRVNGKTIINNSVDADVRNEVLQRPHISIAVNKQRFRFFINEKKHVDIPRMIGVGGPLKSLKFQVNGTRPGKERVFLKNIKVAEGGVDLRRKLISEGKISTNGILFDSGSDNLKAESMGIIRQISQVLQQESGMNLKIVGHTDADGTDDSNLKLSKDRADAVKSTLVNIYNVDSGRLSTEGKGETEPVAENTDADGKAQNRRVEFIKQ